MKTSFSELAEGDKIKRLQEMMDLQLARKANEFYQAYTPTNSRAYTCSLDGCVNPAYAKGLCNAHYIRKRQGRSLDHPLRVNRGRNPNCLICGTPRNGKGGWGLCAKHYRRLRRRTIKEALIEAMGGKCALCGNHFHWVVYDFHHKAAERKEASFGEMLEVSSTSQIAKEMAKCELLCANCHRVTHAEDRA